VPSLWHSLNHLNTTNLVTRQELLGLAASARTGVLSDTAARFFDVTNGHHGPRDAVQTRGPCPSSSGGSGLGRTTIWRRTCVSHW
jgi:hypothetical protein